jgi:hypothetical protein
VTLRRIDAAVTLRRIDAAVTLRRIDAAVTLRRIDAAVNVNGAAAPAQTSTTHWASHRPVVHCLTASAV